MTLQHGAVASIDVHRSQIALVAVFRLLIKLDNTLIFVHLHDTKAIGLFERHGHHAQY